MSSYAPPVISVDIPSLAAGAQRVLSDAAPKPAKMLATKGILPGVPPADTLAVLVELARSGDAEVAHAAKATLDQLPKPLLDGALGHELQAAVIDELASRFGNDLAVLPKLLKMKALAEETLGSLAAGANEAAGEIIATNEALLLRFSSAIERLYMNKRVRMSTADRLVELAVRNKLELDFPAFKLAAQAILEQLIPEPTEEPNFDDLLFVGTDALAEEIGEPAPDEDVCSRKESDEESPEEEVIEEVVERFVPLYVQIQQMTVTQKIRSATLGNSSMRMLLIRDTNRLVAEAAARSPRFSESEATLISSSRSVTDDVLRIISNNRDLTKGYQVKLNLVTNPRTPFTFSSRFLPHLRDNDLRSIARSKNIPGAVVRAARQQLSRKG